MAFKFVLKTDSRVEYRFNLAAANSDTIATSEDYKSPSGPATGIELVRSSIPTALATTRSER
jgi:uncharacterized protein YegP (UPF0339 family)